MGQMAAVPTYSYPAQQPQPVSTTWSRTPPYQASSAPVQFDFKPQQVQQELPPASYTPPPIQQEEAPTYAAPPPEVAPLPSPAGLERQLETLLQGQRVIKDDLDAIKAQINSNFYELE